MLCQLGGLNWRGSSVLRRQEWVTAMLSPFPSPGPNLDHHSPCLGKWKRITIYYKMLTTLMNVKKLYHKPLLLLMTRFIKCTTKKMAKRKGNQTKSNTVQRLRKKYPQRPGDRHDFFLVEKKERYHVVLSKSYTTGWEMNCENKSSIYYFMQ